MKRCLNTYVADTAAAEGDVLHVIDIGAMDVNGSYKQLLPPQGYSYTGVDMAPGKGVDVVVDNPYAYPFPDNSADIVMCGQMMEHCEYFWRAFSEMIRILKPGGYLFLIVPSQGHVHRYPVDCYRFLPDSFPALARLEGCVLVDQWQNTAAYWGDLVGVFRKNISPLETQPAQILDRTEVAPVPEEKSQPLLPACTT
jgi:SAM-dependent methyltransferase